MLLTIAYALSSLMGFLITLLSARKLEVHTFGLFSLAYATTTWIAVIGDFGVGASMIRLYNKYKEDEEKQKAIISSAFLWELLIFLLIALTSPLLTYLSLKTLGLNPKEAFPLFLISFLSGGLFILWMYYQEYLRAKERFFTLSLFVFMYSLLRGLLLLFVYFTYSQSPIAWLLISYTIPLLPLLIFFLFKNLPSIYPFQGLTHTKEILDYSKWIAIASIAGSSILYVSRFILAKLSSLEEVGIFSAGVNLALGLGILYNGLYSFLYPKITAFEKEQINKYLRLLRKISPLYLLASTLGILFLGFVLWYFLGERYAPAIPVFLIVSVLYTLSAFLGLISLILHTFMKPEVIAYVNIFRAMLAGALTYIFSPHLGAVGAALAYGLALVVGNVYMVFRVIMLVRRKNHDGNRK